MTPQQFQRSEEIFRAACGRPATEQTEFVRNSVPDDEQVRDAVLRMLAHDHTPLVDFHNPFGSAVRGLGEQVFASATSDEKLPERIGAYRIVSKIGEGGFGVVYLAEQDNPRRTVALKVLRGTAATPETLKRFEYEAFILGRLHHPGIAQIYEAGVAHVPLAATRSGASMDAAAQSRTRTVGRAFEAHGPAPAGAVLATPYFAMEYVDGPNLLDFAEAHPTGRGPLDIRGRLELIARVCDALQHAHQHGVIHRDLKPENILVVFDDKGTKGLRDSGIQGGTPASFSTAQPLNPPIPFSAQPKILDFGVARMQDFDEQLTLVQTRIGQLVGTPAYMSPEQVAGASADVDTRSDVYAVGVLLYRLLSGRLPYEFTGRSLPEIASVIRDQPPAPLRSTGTTQRSGRFDADVSAIVMKTLAKERERRYQSAAELAADIRRYLGGLPIEAKRDSALYVLRTALKRYRGMVAGAAALLIASLIFTIVAVRQSVENRRLATDAIAARDQATQQAESLRRSLYSSRLGYAFAAHYTNDALRMGGLLEQCPKDLRGWEWSFLHYLADRSIFTFSASEFAPDGSRSAALADGSTLVTWHSDKTVAGYDLKSGTCVFRFPTDSNYLMMAAAPDGQRFAMIHVNGDITVHDAGNGETTLCIPNPPENNLKRVQRTAWDLTFSEDSRTLIAGGPLGHVWQWDAASGERLAQWRLSTAGIARMQSVPGSTMIVCCDLYGSILLWDLARASWVGRSGGLSEAPTAVAVSPDGQWFAIAIAGEGIQIRQLPTLELRTNIESREMLISSIAFSPDSKRLISAGSERAVRQWNVATGQEFGALRGHRGTLSFCTFAGGGERIVAAAANGEIKTWLSDTRVDLPEMRLGGSENSAFALSRDGRWAAVADGLGTLTLVDAELLEVVSRFKAHVGPLYDLEFSPDGSTLYSAGMDGAVYEWPGPTPSRETRALIGTRPRGVRSLAISPDGLRFATGSMVGTIVIQDIAGRGPATEISGAHATVVRAMQFDPSGTNLVSAGDDGAIRLWNAADGSFVREVARHHTVVNDVTFDPSGRWIAAVGSDFYTGLFDLSGTDPPRTFKTKVRGVSGCTFSPDGRRLLTCGGDRNIQIWDPLTGEELLVLTGHSALVRFVRFSADSRRLVSCASDCTLRFWETSSAQNDAMARRHAGPDGRGE